MGGRYGMSFAAELIEKGHYEEAIEAATTEMEADIANPEPFADRAAAYDYLERYTEAVSDLERALILNAPTPVIDQDNLDDAFFSALVGAAKVDAQGSVAAAIGRLSRYRHLLPGGRHLQDAEDWRKRFGGELKSELDATTET
jgi:tetratricopeptide (TPR) repeat protein